MPNRTSTTGSELFIVDNSDVDWKVVRYLHDWADISTSFDVIPWAPANRLQRFTPLNGKERTFKLLPLGTPLRSKWNVSSFTRTGFTRPQNPPLV
jgi:hypothetical protein